MVSPTHEPTAQPHVSDGAGAAARAEQRLERRLDWRFLLPDPEPQRIAFLGPPAGMLGEALRGLNAPCVRLDAAATAPNARADLVVVQDAPLVAAALAWAAVEPGGTLYWELSRRGPHHNVDALRTWRDAERLMQQLTQLGCRDARLHWHRPDFDTCLEIIPLQAPAVLDWVLCRPAGTRAAAAKRLVARVLRRCGQLPTIATCISVVAERDAEAGAPP